MTAHSPMSNELILLPSLRAQRGPRGGLVLTRKYMTGAAEYARHWPGPVTTLARLRETPTTDMDHAEYLPGEGETGLELRPETEAAFAARLRSAAVVLALLSREEAPTARLCYRAGVPIVFTSEYTPRTERQILDAEVSNPLLRLRRRVWLWRAERMRRATLDIAAGLQCSGTPTYDIYRGLCRDTLLFFDNRVRVDSIIERAALEAKTARLRLKAPLRLVFGGRLIAMKGVLELPRVAAELARLGIPFSFDIFGSGPLSEALESRIRAEGLEGRMALRGALDFESGWIPHLRENADLFVCCHPQGDPSSTYPEVMSCGVPIAGYANEAFRGLVAQSGAGWAVPMFDARGLAQTIARLHGDRDDLARHAVLSRDFASRHAFEATFAARAAHLVRNSRLPEALRRAEAFPAFAPAAAHG
jgi:colanic acid/amylovoran biosynthesis glycosyltransferase